jgi:hypothetical protein
MPTTCFFKTSVGFHQATRRFIVEDGTFCRRLVLSDEEIGPLMTEQKQILSLYRLSSVGIQIR